MIQPFIQYVLDKIGGIFGGIGESFKPDHTETRKNIVVFKKLN